MTDELGLINAVVLDDDLTLYIINGLSPAYHDIVSSIHIRGSPFHFKELRDHLIEHELYLKQIESDSTQLVGTINIVQSHFSSFQDKSNSNCSHSGDRGQSINYHGRGIHGRGSGQNYSHSAHMAQSPTHNLNPNTWLMDTEASHNITNDLGKLSIHFEYDDTDELKITDGNGMPITHSRTSHIKTPARTFTLSNALCVLRAAPHYPNLMLLGCIQPLTTGMLVLVTIMMNKF
ncbi:hypothetical protein C2S51_029871 [Perilla frutescens var. frutescens]|nr:hypothetical protein C2S51_029871 [Perilla frutescens var. frutescens]